MPFTHNHRPTHTPIHLPPPRIWIPYYRPRRHSVNFMRTLAALDTHSAFHLLDYIEHPTLIVRFEMRPIPSLTLFAGIPLKEAICVGLFLQSIPQTIPGFLLYYKKGYFKMHNSVILLISSFIGISIGSYINYSNMISEKHLYCLLSVFLVLSGMYMYYAKVLMCDK